MSANDLSNLQLPEDNMDVLATPNTAGTCDGTYCQTGYHPSSSGVGA